MTFLKATMLAAYIATVFNLLPSSATTADEQKKVEVALAKTAIELTKYINGILRKRAEDREIF